MLTDFAVPSGFPTTPALHAYPTPAPLGWSFAKLVKVTSDELAFPLNECLSEPFKSVNVLGLLLSVELITYP